MNKDKISLKDSPELESILKETLIAERTRSQLFLEEAISSISERHDRIAHNKVVVKQINAQIKLQVVQSVLTFAAVVAVLTLLYS